MYKEDRTQNYDPGRTSHIPFSQLNSTQLNSSVLKHGSRMVKRDTMISFSINYDETHKPLLKREIKYDLYKIAQKIKTQKLTIWTFEVFTVFKNQP